MMIWVTNQLDYFEMTYHYLFYLLYEYDNQNIPTGVHFRRFSVQFRINIFKKADSENGALNSN